MGILDKWCSHTGEGDPPFFHLFGCSAHIPFRRGVDNSVGRNTLGIHTIRDSTQVYYKIQVYYIGCTKIPHAVDAMLISTYPFSIDVCSQWYKCVKQGESVNSKHGEAI
jgi:hypothetical protein